MISFCGQKGCALAVAGVPWDLTVAPGLLENLSFHRTHTLGSVDFTGSEHWIHSTFHRVQP